MSRRRTRRESHYRSRVARLEQELAALRLEVEKLQEWQKAEIVIRALQEGNEPEPGSAAWWLDQAKKGLTQPVSGIFPPPQPLPQPSPYIGDSPGWWQQPVIYTGSGTCVPDGSTTDVKGGK